MRLPSNQNNYEIDDEFIRRHGRHHRQQQQNEGGVADPNELRNTSNTIFGSNIVKPSELFGSLKKSVKSSLRGGSRILSHNNVNNNNNNNENKPRDVKCECKHHQQKYLFERQEEQRKRLKLQLLQRGDWRKASALTRSYLSRGSGSLIDEPQDQDSLDGHMAPPSGSPSRNPMGSMVPPPPTSGGDDHVHVEISSNGAPLTDAFTKSHKKHRRVSKEPSIQHDPISESSGGEMSEEDGESSAHNSNHHHHHHSNHHGHSHKKASEANSVPSGPSIDKTVSNKAAKSEKSVKTNSTSANHQKSNTSSASSSNGNNSVLSNLNPFSGVLWDRRESFSHLWISMSSMYGKLLVLLMLAFCLTEVMDNKIRPLQFQAIYMMYLYVGSIIAIMCIYISVLLDNCPSLTKSSSLSTSALKDNDPESGSIVSFNGTLRRAHIDRTKVSRTSFYLRVGALVFGLGTLIFNGLEIAMHATMERNCVGNLMLAHPVLQALFTFLQMHFLFINSQVIVERFGLFARFGFMHLMATNLALWVRTIIWESANEWIHHIHRQRLISESITDPSNGAVAKVIPNFTPIALALRTGTFSNNYFSDRSFTNVNDKNFDYIDDFATPDSETQGVQSNLIGSNSLCNDTSPISSDHLKYVVDLYQCFNENTLGQLWTSSMPYLFPFIVEYRIKIELHFSLIAAAVTYIMWQNVGKDKIGKKLGNAYISKKIYDFDDEKKQRRRDYWRVDCQSASKGLFLGLLCLVGGIIILIIFFVMKDTPEFIPQMFWIYNGSEIIILTLAIFGCLTGFIQLQKLSPSYRQPYALDSLLANVTVIGAYIYGIFSMIASIAHGDYTDRKNIAVFVTNVLLIFQVSTQGMIISEASRRICSTRNQQISKPGRQLVTFLLFVNITLWVLDTFMSHNWVTQQLQLGFYGILAWGIISRISFPLLIFYRFHSCVVLVEIWKNTYRTKESL